MDLIPYIKALSIDQLLNFKPKKKQKIDVVKRNFDRVKQ